jgi:hypothetical protein
MTAFAGLEALCNRGFKDRGSYCMAILTGQLAVAAMFVVAHPAISCQSGVFCVVEGYRLILVRKALELYNFWILNRTSCPEGCRTENAQAGYEDYG